VAAQGQTQQPTFRAAIDIVHLDVSVLDKDRHPVRGLTAADFTILEDGKPQKIAAFTPIDVPDAPAPVADDVKWTRDVPPDVQTNALPADGRLWVLVLDDLLIPFDPSAIESAKKAARSVITHLNAADQMAVVFTGESAGTQSFTNDRGKLLAAVDQLRPGRASYRFGWDVGRGLPPLKTSGMFFALSPAMDPDDGLREAAVRTLTGVADALIAAPDRRKALVYISPGVPINFAALGPILASGGATVNGAVIASSMVNVDANSQLAGELTPLFQRMQRANITMYTIDPCGLDGLAGYMRSALQSTLSNGTLSVDTSGIMTEPTGAGGILAPELTSLVHFESSQAINFLLTAAANTGGRAIVNTNDFEPGITSMFQENGSYYLIGYQATDPGTGKLHRLSVKVDRPDLEVRTRSGYYASDAKADAKAAKTSPVVTAIASVLPKPDVPLQVALAPFASATSSGATVAIVLGVSQPAPRDHAIATFDLQTNAFTPDGVPKGVAAQTAKVTIMAGSANETAKYEVLSRIDLAPGRYQLRLAAHSTTDSRTGSVFADVQVPDFANAPVSFSGVLLTASPGLTAAPRDALAAIVPVVPTAERTFRRRDTVTAFLRVYQGGKTPLVDVQLPIHIVDADGKVIVDRVDTIAATSFDGTTRAADERIALPLTTLPAGEYLLTIEAALGKGVARRDLRFTVK
jgi:VWFA-related protein